MVTRGISTVGKQKVDLAPSIKGTRREKRGIQYPSKVNYFEGDREMGGIAPVAKGETHTDWNRTWYRKKKNKGGGEKTRNEGGSRIQTVQTAAGGMGGDRIQKAKKGGGGSIQRKAN